MTLPKLEPCRDDPVTLCDGRTGRVLDTYGASGPNRWICYVFAPGGSRFASVETKATDFLWSEICAKKS